MKTLNIDTLVLSGQGALILTEGSDNTPVESYKGLCIGTNIRKLEHAADQFPRDPLTGELKRIIMLLQLRRYGEPGNSSLYDTNLYSKVYTQMFLGNMTFKIGLSVKRNALVLKLITLPHCLVDAYEASEYLSRQAEMLQEVESYIERANKVLIDLFDKY